MDFFLNEFVDWVFTLSAVSIYTVFFVVAYLENVIPPLPGDLLVAFGGYLAAEQVVGFVNLLWLTTLASVLGFMTMYAVGSYWGYKIDKEQEQLWLLRWINISYFHRGRRWMQSWGQWVIFLNRFLAGTRSVISLTAGIYRTRVKTTIVNSTLSSLLWNSILLGFGWFVHDNWSIIGDYLSLYGWVVLILIATLVMSRVIWKRRNRYESVQGGKNSN